MEKEIAMGFGVSVICLLASSFVAPPRESLPSSYRSLYPVPSALAETSIDRLPDGHYHFCQSVTLEATTADRCFLFQKENDRIIGQYQSTVPSDPSQTRLCLEGQVRGNVISGKATYFSNDFADLIQQRPELQASELTAWDVTGNSDDLQVAAGQTISLKSVNQDSTAIESVQAILFSKATLDLSDFQQNSTVPVSAPTSCDAS
ncbi:hypothetical protein [Thermocoleostomius sinensis]|jgi:hypothetical protein|uniref:Uncharacterized protein n=1 Tax=Thermocoleostomius sinensis A174 TaxID=2016057 RepID=A0A9E8ZCX2_9CYAN|nr:hypothetical protein [Thermocoleostomius sinensis]WAL60955.1 hypothetical protein OXH18_02855 [Thermocoleostomius sinensis A174]